MSKLLGGASLLFEGKSGDTNIYRISLSSVENRYFMLSNPSARRLLAYPEVVGFDCYRALLDATRDGLKFLLPTAPAGGMDIFTILRGGLNYPLEEAAFECGIPVREMHFVSCERVIEDHKILGLEVRYQKITPSPERVVAIGDILATGDTLRLCFEHLINEFYRCGGSLRRFIFFTIGGTRAIDLFENLTAKVKALFPGFEGFDCCFFEGMFTVYTDNGASGINTPNIDFGWNGGIVTPEFRRYVMEHPDALMEKCIIYDGGARRYELPLHFAEVLDYWMGIFERADKIDAHAMLCEKLGYDAPLSYEDWLVATHLGGLGDLHGLWSAEMALLGRGFDLKELASRRIESMKQTQKIYETH